jgi:hypothetical protein
MTHQIVPENILALFPGRAVNFHPAILPHYRGPNPRAGMILDGKADLYGGITLHCLSRGIDRGDIIAMRKVPTMLAAASFIGMFAWRVPPLIWCRRICRVICKGLCVHALKIQRPETTEK